MLLNENLLFELERRAVASSYRAHATERGAQEWADYSTGDTQHYVCYIQPLVAAVVRSCSQIDLQSKDLPHRILARIEGLSETLPSVDARPDLLLPITWPWMHMTVFSRAEFKTAMYIAIRRELGETSEIDVSDKTENAAPERVASLKPPRRHGYPADMNRHKGFQEIVSKHATNWRKSSRSWKCLDVLRPICLDLDEAIAGDHSLLFDIPRGWRTGETKPLRGNKINGWYHALQMGYRKLVTDQIGASLRIVLKRESEAVKIIR